MTIKTEVGTAIIVIFAIIAGVAVVIGEKKISKNLDSIEASVAQNKSALDE